MHAHEELTWLKSYKNTFINHLFRFGWMGLSLSIHKSYYGITIRTTFSSIWNKSFLNKFLSNKPVLTIKNNNLKFKFKHTHSPRTSWNHNNIHFAHVLKTYCSSFVEKSVQWEWCVSHYLHLLLTLRHWGHNKATEKICPYLKGHLVDKLPPHYPVLYHPKMTLRSH